MASITIENYNDYPQLATNTYLNGTGKLTELKVYFNPQSWRGAMEAEKANDRQTRLTLLKPNEKVEKYAGIDERKTFVEQTLAAFFEWNKDIIDLGGEREIFVYTEALPPPKKAKKISDELEMFSSQGRMFIRAKTEKIGKQKYRYPCYDPDVIVHELMHCISYWTRSQVEHSQNPQIDGVDEAFCDYFAIVFNLELKRRINDGGGFDHLLAPTLAYFWNGMKYGRTNKKNVYEQVEINATCEAVGAGNRFAKRDYSQHVKTTLQWKDDEHHYGRQLAKGFLEFRSIVQDTRSFDKLIWDFFSIYVVKKTTLDYVEFFLAYIRDNRKRYSCLDGFKDDEDMLTSALSAWFDLEDAKNPKNVMGDDGKRLRNRYLSSR